MSNDDALILQDLAADLDPVSPMKAMAARSGAQALRDAETRLPHLKALLDELDARDVKEAIVKAQKLKEANGEPMDETLPGM